MNKPFKFLVIFLSLLLANAQISCDNNDDCDSLTMQGRNAPQKSGGC